MAKRSISVKLPAELVEMMDELVAVGRYPNRSELVRAAVEEVVKRELFFPGFAPYAHRRLAEA